MDSFDSINDNKEEKEINKTIYNYIIISAICFFIFILLLILILVLFRIILERFGTFILKTWLVPALFIVIVLNYLLYYAKIAIGTFLLFHCYHLRNRGRFFKILFWIFVDKTMIYKYKIRNFITKYQKEFNYL